MKNPKCVKTMDSFRDMQSYIKSKIGEPYYLKVDKQKSLDQNIAVVSTTLSSVEFKEQKYIDLQTEKDLKSIRKKFKKIAGCSRNRIKKKVN